jgi:hypothetical protein
MERPGTPLGTTAAATGTALHRKGTALSRHNGRRPWRKLAAVLTGLALAAAAAGTSPATRGSVIAFHGTDGRL